MRLPGLVASASVVALLWLTVGAVAARAQQGEDFVRKGFYVGLAGVYGSRPFVEGEAEDALPTGAEADADAGLGVNVRVGFRFHSHFAAELETEWRAKSDIDLLLGTENRSEVELRTEKLIAANAKGYLFLGRVQPYVLIGAGVMSVELDGELPSSKDSAFSMNFAGGADIYLTEQVSFNAELRWVLPTGKLDGFDELSVLWGFQYHF